MKEQRQRKDKFFSNSGITLIALVITIIVLLILAGISIASLVGENGLLTQVNNAKIETRAGAVEERKEQWLMENNVIKYENGTNKKYLGEVIEELKEEELLTSEEVSEIIDTGKVTIGTKTIIFRKLEAGLYDSKENKLIKTWNELIENGDIIQENGILEYCNYRLVGEIVISDEIKEIESYAFDVNNTITEIVIPNSVVTIRYDAFCACKALKEIRIPTSVELIENYAIDVSDALERIIVSEKNPNYSSDKGILYNKDKTKIIKVPENFQNDKINIHGNVTSIEEYSFDNCKNIKEIIISNNVTTIGSNVFSDCTAIVTINKPKDSITGAPWRIKSPGKIVWQDGETAGI